MRKTKRMYVLLVVAGLVISYLCILIYKGIEISETTLSTADRNSLEDCSLLTKSIGENFAIPISVSAPEKRAIFCSLEISPLFRKYRKISLYGITHAEAQKPISQFVEAYRGPSKPIKLVIYEKENWIVDSPSGGHRGPEKELFELWLE